MAGEEPPQKRWRRDEFAHHLSDFDQELLKREADEEEAKFESTGIRSLGMVITCKHGVPLERWMCQTCVKEAIERIENDCKPDPNSRYSSSSAAPCVKVKEAIERIENECKPDPHLSSSPSSAAPQTIAVAPKKPQTSSVAQSIGFRRRLSTLVFSTPRSTPASESKGPSDYSDNESTQEWGDTLPVVA